MPGLSTVGSETAGANTPVDEYAALLPRGFDPAYDAQLIRDAADATQTLRIQTSEPVVLTAPNIAPSKRASQQGASQQEYRHLPVPHSGDLYVNGDIVRIEGELSLPGRAVQINARVLEIDWDSADKAPAIDVSGGPPDPPDAAAPRPSKATSGPNAVFEYVFLAKDKYTPPKPGVSGQPGKDGRPGAAGKKAGWVVLHCGEIVGPAPRGVTARPDGKPAPSPSAFGIRAAGGKGQDGQAGQDGQPGGDGGKGADAWKGGVADTFTATNGANAGAGGAGGRGGAGGPGGNGGDVRVFSISPLPASLEIEPHVIAGEPGGWGTPGRPGPDGTPGAGGKAWSVGQSDAGTTTGRTVAQGPGTYLPPGKPGGIQPPISQPPLQPPATVTSKPGTPTIKPGCGYADVAASARSEQLEMLLAQIRHDGLGLDRTDHEAVAALGRRIKWLVGVSTAYVPGGPKDPVSAVRMAAAGIAKNFQDPTLDWFGNTRDWAPTVSLSQYDDLLDKSLEVFKDAETAWSAYRSARNAGEAAEAKSTSAGKAINGQLRTLQDRQQAARDRLSALAADISSREDSVDRARKTILDAEEKFKANVQKHVSLSFWKYLDVIEQTAFCMSDPPAAGTVYATEQLKFWKGAFADLPGDDGQSIPKDHMVRKLDTFGDTVKTLDEAFDVVNGYIQLKDKDGYKLLCTQKSLNDLLDNFHAVEGADEAMEAMAEYVREVTARNAAVLDYNATRASLAQQVSDIRRLTAQRDVVEADAVTVGPPAVDRSIQFIYDRAKQACVDDLYRAMRAYRFWSLGDYDVFRDVLQCQGPADVTHLEMEAGRAWLLEERVKDLEKFVGDLQPRRDPVTASKVSAGRLKQIRAQLLRDRGKDADDVERAHFWEFHLDPAVRGSTSDDTDFVPDMANVRLVEIRAWLVGLKPAAHQTVTVHITQLGDEQIVSQTGHVVPVEHDPVEKIFEYAGQPGSKDGIETHAYYWDQDAPVAPGKLPDHTPIGPFATWRIGLRPQDFGGTVDWHTLIDGLTEIRLEFFVRRQGFSTQATKEAKLSAAGSRAGRSTLRV